MKTRFRVTGAFALLLAFVMLIAVTGCGSSSDTGSNTSSGTTAAGGDTTAAEGEDGGSTSAGVKAAEESIAPYLKPPTDIGVSEPLKETPKNITIDFLESSAPAAKQLGDALEEAADALGAKLTRINAGLSPQTIQRAWSQAIANPPDAVFEGGFPIQLMKVPLTKMKELGVPVLTAYSEEAPGLTHTVVGSKQFETTGTQLADFVTAQSGGEAKALLVSNHDVPGLTPQEEFLKKTYKENCEGCSLETIEVPLDGIGRTIPGEVVSFLQQNPDTNWVIFSTPEFVTGVPQALKAAGIDDVKAVTQSETPIALEYIKNEELLEATYGISLEFTSWRTIDTAARLILGQEAPENEASPAQFLFAEDLTFDISQPWPSVANFKQKFEELWGVAN